MADFTRVFVVFLKEFVYLFAPLRHLLKEADLQNFRLENGLKIWPALWDYRHPNAQCFTAPVRPKKSTTIRKKANNAATSSSGTTAALSVSNPPSIPTATAVTPVPCVPLTPRETVTFNDVFIGKVILVVPINDLSLSMLSLWRRRRLSLLSVMLSNPQSSNFPWFIYIINRIDRSWQRHRGCSFSSRARCNYLVISFSIFGPFLFAESF